MKKVLITALAVLLACPALAAPNCGTKEVVYDILIAKHGETRRIGGQSKFGNLFEFWANPKTGSWTVVKVHANGLHCIVDEGQLFHEFSAIPEGDPA